MSVSVGIFDLLPVAVYFVSMCLLSGCLLTKLSPVTYAVFSGGFIMVFLAGVFKASWKILFTAGVCDFQKLNACFFPMQATGFLLVSIALSLMLITKGRNPVRALAVAAVPAVFAGTWIFVAMMCAGIIAISSCLFILAKKLDKQKTGMFFVISCVGLLMMGYLSSRDFDKAIFNWIAEGVNLISQLSLLWGIIQLKRAGLKYLALGPKLPEPPIPNASPVPESPMFDAPVLKINRAEAVPQKAEAAAPEVSISEPAEQSGENSISIN